MIARRGVRLAYMALGHLLRLLALLTRSDVAKESRFCCCVMRSRYVDATNAARR